MRGVRTWQRGRATFFFYSLVIAAAGLLLAGQLAASDNTTTTSTTATILPPATAIADNLQRVFSGSVPTTIADLKAMQTHVQKITDRLAKCTVGVEVGPAQGSGVIISKDGYVLTAAHVASPPIGGRRGRTPGGDEVTFHLSDGRQVTGKTLGLNRTLDAGLLKITDPGDYPYAEMGDSDGLKLGQWCVVMGHPGGYQEDRGVVLRVGRILNQYKDKGREETITTDCTLVGGDSGGPLFDMEGRVIGINSRISESIKSNLHVPVSAYKESWDRLVHGEVWGHLPGREPYLGVRGDENAKDARIGSVVPDSPAEQAGLKKGDVILKFGDKDIADFQSLKDAVAEPRPRRQQQIAIKVRRGEETIELKVKLAYQ
jgi:serine protease Do